MKKGINTQESGVYLALIRAYSMLKCKKMTGICKNLGLLTGKKKTLPHG
jgi:hypothetical protein